MAKIYTTSQDFISTELNFDTDTQLRADFDYDELMDLLEEAGLVEYFDGWDEEQQVFWLPNQGFRWTAKAEEDENGTRFWDIVANLDAKYGMLCDSGTGDCIGTATKAELLASLKAGTDEGHFDREGRSCYVDSEVTARLIRINYESDTGSIDTVGVFAGDELIDTVEVESSADPDVYDAALVAAGYRNLSISEGN